MYSKKRKGFVIRLFITLILTILAHQSYYLYVKYLTWNVNGLRAIVSKGFEEYMRTINPDIIGVQEVKMSAELPQIELTGYYDI